MILLRFIVPVYLAYPSAGCSTEPPQTGRKVNAYAYGGMNRRQEPPNGLWSGETSLKVIGGIVLPPVARGRFDPLNSEFPADVT